MMSNFGEEKRIQHVVHVICKVLQVKIEEVTNIVAMKKGMTNRSFVFNCKGKKYVIRIPGAGTDQLINRRQEADVYRVIDGKHICDDIVYIDPDNGYKITEFLEGARVCDPFNRQDIKKCMKKLRDFHALKFQVQHTFDIFKQMDFYESLWNGSSSAYRDYKETKNHVLSLGSVKCFSQNGLQGLA